MKLPCGLLLAGCLAAAAWGQATEDVARDAASTLAHAAAGLDAARTARDRVSALTDVVGAYEDGLAAMRSGLRDMTEAETVLERDLAAKEDRTSRLLAVLQTIERLQGTAFPTHPDGVLEMARAAMLLSDGLPVLEAEAADLRADLSALADLRVAQEAAAADLQAGLAGIESARLALSEAIADRAALPRPLAEDTEAVEVLARRAADLDAFADDLADLPGGAAAPVSGPFDLPVRGDLLRTFRAEDAAGISRPGMVIGTEPRALLAAVVTGTIRYAGPLLDYGNVIVQEPRPGLLLVFAGLGDLYVSSGDIVTHGGPLGLMGGVAPDAAEISSQDGATTGALPPEALYVEVREAGRPVDPATWFAME